MAFADVHNWLRNKGPFAAGVELLKLHGTPSSTDLFVFSLRESSMSRERLEKALSGIDAKATKKVQDIPVPTLKERQRDADDIVERSFHRSLRKPPENIPEQALPQELRPLRRSLDRMWREKILLKGSLPSLPNGMDLRRTAEQIVELGKKIRAGWEVIERWRTHGVVLRTDQAEPVPVHQLVGRRDSLRVQISRTKSRIKSGALLSTPEVMEKLGRKQTELADILKLLKHGTATPQ